MSVSWIKVTVKKVLFMYILLMPNKVKKEMRYLSINFCKKVNWNLKKKGTWNTQFVTRKFIHTFKI